MPRSVIVATRLSDTSHEALGLVPDDLLAMYHTMLTARLVDEAAFRLNRQGMAPFVVPVSGHEGCQIGTAWALERGRADLGWQADARPLELPAAGDHLGLVSHRDPDPSRLGDRLRGQVPGGGCGGGVVVR